MLMQWWDALEVLRGSREVGRNVEKGLRMARECSHPDAKWLCSLFSPGASEPVLVADVWRVMEAQGEDDPRALHVLAGLFSNPHYSRERIRLLRRAAELGYAPAQAELSFCCPQEEELKWAKAAAAQGDRAGLAQLAWCLEKRRGCESDAAKVDALFLEAAELGDVGAMFAAGLYAFSECQWERYLWWGRAAARGCSRVLQDFHLGAKRQLKWYEAGGGSGRVIFELGAAYRGHVDVRGLVVFGERISKKKRAEVAQRCVDLHERWCRLARAAIECWLLVAARLGVVKDIRLLLARSLWESRSDWSSVLPYLLPK